MPIELGFVIAGCAKSGTTALAEALDRHERIYMSDVKETNYFVHGFEPVSATRTANGRTAITFGNPADHVDTAEAFEALFAGAGPGQVLGEASPLYLLSPGVPRRLLEHNPDLRVVLVLRNPADVVHSNFVHHVRDGAESVEATDLAALLDEDRYRAKDLHAFARHLELPRYATLLPRWVEAFGPDRLHVEIFEEFRADPDATLERTARFLGLEPAAAPAEGGAVNQSRLPRFARLHRFVLEDGLAKAVLRRLVPVKRRRRLRLLVERLNAGDRPTLGRVERARLDARYAIDREYVETLLGRRIEPWRALLAGARASDDGPARAAAGSAPR